MNQLRIRSVLLTALTLLCGLHVLRAFLPTLIWYLSRHVPLGQLALYALSAVALGLLAPAVRRGLGDRSALALTVGGLALARLAIQVAEAPAVDLVLATMGLVLWGWFLALWPASPRNRPTGDDIPVLVVAFPLAFLLDTGSRSLLWSYDLAWRHGLGALLLAAGLAGLILTLLGRELADGPTAVEEPSLGHVWPWVGLGPWLYLALALFHNPAAWVAATGWADAPAHLATTVSTALGAVTCVLVAGWPARRRTPGALLAGGLLVGALALFTAGVEPAGLWLALASWTAWAALGWVLAGTASVASRQPGMWRTTLATFLALLLMLVTGVLAFEPLAVRAAEWPGLPPAWVPVVTALAPDYRLAGVLPAAGGVLLLAAVGAARGPGSRVGAAWRASSTLVSVVASTILLVVGLWALADTPPQHELPVPEGRPLRVMTYNIHQGLDADMRVDLEAIAAVIATEDPDVVALNEVNRARAFNGFVDTLPLLSRRTGLPYVFGANYADGQYGNAVLSRYPILAWDNTPHQHNTTEVRGLLRVVAAAPGGPITFYITHLDHTGGPHHARAAQVAEILARWDHTPRAVLLAAEAFWTLAPGDEPPDRFPDGIITHSFYNQPEADLALEAIARAYGEEPRPTPRDAAQRALAGRTALLLLDGTEQADDLGVVLAVRGGCGVLITTRQRQDVVAERCDVAPLPAAEAVELLQAWGREQAADEAAVRRICELVGRLPLAVRLVGRYLARTGEPAAEYLAWLAETPIAALSHGAHREDSVELLLARSVEQVSEAAGAALAVVGQLALAALGVEPVSAGLETPARDTKRALGELVSYGLLLREGDRYTVSHALVHVYARQRLEAVGDEALGRLAGYYDALARAESEQGLEGYHRLDAERAHLLRVLAGCVAREQWAAARRLVWAVDSYLDIQGHGTERVTALELGVQAAQRSRRACCGTSSAPCGRATPWGRRWPSPSWGSTAPARPCWPRRWPRSAASTWWRRNPCAPSGSASQRPTWPRSRPSTRPWSRC